jgi:hypothetical protein
VQRLKQIGELPAIALLSMGPNVQLYSTPAVVEGRLRMRTMVDLERIIWRTSKSFVSGNGYNVVLASKP